MCCVDHESEGAERDFWKLGIKATGGKPANATPPVEDARPSAFPLSRTDLNLLNIVTVVYNIPNHDGEYLGGKPQDVWKLNRMLTGVFLTVSLRGCPSAGGRDRRKG